MVANWKRSLTEKNHPEVFGKISQEQFFRQYPNLEKGLPKDLDSSKKYLWDWRPQGPIIGKYHKDQTYFANAYSRPHRQTELLLVKYVKTEKEEKEIYNYQIRFDHLGGRATHEGTMMDPSEPVVLAIGCSWTIGEGVDQGEDYPSQLQKAIGNQWQVYNFGFHSYGPNDLLRELEENPQRFDFLKGRKVKIIWIFLPTHLDRMLCSTRCLANQDLEFIHHKPFYALRDGVPEFNGKFLRASSLERQWMLGLKKSALLSFFNIDYPLRLRDRDIQLVTALFSQLKKRISQQALEVEDFSIINTIPFIDSDKLGESLKQSGFRYLDYGRYPLEILSSRLKIPYDNHPTPEYYWILAQMLKRDLF